MDSIKIAIWRAIIAVMFIVFFIVVVLPAIIFELIRAAVNKFFREEMYMLVLS